MGWIINFPLFSIILSLFSGVLCTLLSGKAARRYTLCLECLLIALVSAVLWYTVSSGESFTYSMGEFPAPWGNEIRAGTLEALMALVLLVVLLCSVLGGRLFLSFDIVPAKQPLYFSAVNLMTAALMALIWTNDIFTGYVFLEIMTLASCGLLIVRQIGRTTLAAVRYMIMNLLGSGLFLLGVVLLYNLTGHLLMVPMRTAVAEIMTSGGTTELTFTIAILLIGLGLKSGLFPFYFWMPDTYGSATPSSAAILSSLVSKAYIFLLFKIIYRAIGIDTFLYLQLHTLILILGLLGMIIGSFSAIRCNNINRMVAFSSAAQIGYIYMGIGLGGDLGYAAAMFQIIAHSVTKSMLFLTTPWLAEVSGDSLLFRNLHGSGRRAKDAGIFFTLGALSMVGIPLFAGFSSKLFFAIAAAEIGDLVSLAGVMLGLALSSVLNAVYFIRTVIRIYAEGRGGADLPLPEYEIKKEPAVLRQGRRWYRFSAGILVLINLFLGLFSWITMDLIEAGLNMFA